MVTNGHLSSKKGRHNFHRQIDEAINRKSGY